MEWIIFYWVLTLIICWWNFYIILKGNVNQISETRSITDYVDCSVNYFIVSGSLITFMTFMSIFHV